MSYTADRHEQNKSDMLGELNKAIADAEGRRKEDDDAAPAPEIPEEKGDDAAAGGCAGATPPSGETAVGNSDPEGRRPA